MVTNGVVMDDFNMFLNHCGLGVKVMSFVLLEYTLCYARFCPFLDAHAMMKGDPALRSIDQALEMAKAHVMVVLRRYVELKHCPNELLAMMKSNKPVVLMLYNVEPMDVW